MQEVKNGVSTYSPFAQHPSFCQRCGVLRIIFCHVTLQLELKIST